MRKITLLLFAAATLLSCSDDDNQPVSIDGTWKLTYVTLGTTLENPDQNNDGVISPNFTEEVPCLKEANIVFTDNTSAVFSATCWSNEYDPQILNYTTSKDSVKFVYTSVETPGASKKVTFKRSGNTLTATFNYEDFSYIPGDGEYGDTNSMLWGATFTYTKQ